MKHIRKRLQSSFLLAFGFAIGFHALLGVVLWQISSDTFFLYKHVSTYVEWSVPSSLPAFSAPWIKRLPGSMIGTPKGGTEPQTKPRKLMNKEHHPSQINHPSSLLSMRSNHGTPATPSDPSLSLNSDEDKSAAGSHHSAEFGGHPPQRSYPNLLAGTGVFDGPLGVPGQKNPNAGGTTRRAVDGDMPFGWEDPETGAKIAKQRFNTMVADVSAEQRAKSLFRDPYLAKVERSIASKFAPPKEMVQLRNRLGTLATQGFEKKVAHWYHTDVELTFSPAGSVIATLVVQPSGNSQLDQLALDTVREAVAQQRISVGPSIGRARYRISAGVVVTPLGGTAFTIPPPYPGAPVPPTAPTLNLGFSFGGPSQDKPGDSLATKLERRLDYPLKETVETKVTLLAVYPRQPSTPS